MILSPSYFSPGRGGHGREGRADIPVVSAPVHQYKHPDSTPLLSDLKLDTDVFAYLPFPIQQAPIKVKSGGHKNICITYLKTKNTWHFLDSYFEDLRLLK